MPSEYDIRMRFYLNELMSNQILDNTIVIFLSDHGMRYGEIRNYFTGWLEERLPFLFIWLPESFKLKYPNFAENLRINQKRLVSPFDLHITIKHILKLANGLMENPSSEDCPTCQSLFHEVPKNRSCPDAGINEQYCTCNPFTDIDKNSTKVLKIADFSVEKLNSDLKSFKNCSELKLNKVLSASEFVENGFEYLIAFEVLPSFGHMEATIKCADEECAENLSIIGDISRINYYGDQSKCISDARMRKYCFCK